MAEPHATAATPQVAPPQRPRRGVILAGGKGLRANPQSRLLNKCLFVVHDHSLIEGQIAILRDQLGVHEIVVVLGHLAGQVREALGDGSALGVTLHYVEVERIEDGPARGLLQARAFLDEPFFLTLGDEYHHQSRHNALLDWLDRAPDALLTYTHTPNPQQIMANFSIEIDNDGRLRGLTEKPRRLHNDLCGCGTLYLTPRVVEAIERAKPSPRSGRVELYEVVAAVAREGSVFAVDIQDPDYVNINTLDDLHRARFRYRSLHWPTFKTTVIIPAWNEAESIEYVVRDFLAHPQVDEVLVMDNLSQDGTAQVAERAGARVVSRRLRGYGDALRQGLDEADGDILVLTEADYTFRAADLNKLLEYLKDADCVVGTRTTREMIAQGANMPTLARIGNVLMAKYLEGLWLWLEPRFTDVGCTYRAIWRTEWQEMAPRMTGIGPEFSPEMMLEVVRANKRCIEVPVSYYPRFSGDSKHSKGLIGLARTASRMWWLITSRWFAAVGLVLSNWLGGRR